MSNLKLIRDKIDTFNHYQKIMTIVKIGNWIIGHENFKRDQEGLKKIFHTLELYHIMFGEKEYEVISKEQCFYDFELLKDWGVELLVLCAFLSTGYKEQLFDKYLSEMVCKIAFQHALISSQSKDESVMTVMRGLNYIGSFLPRPLGLENRQEELEKVLMS